jgi:hypothetical protein
MALLFLAMAIGIVFFAPLEALSRNGGRGSRSGDMFLGWVLLFGEPIARAILGTVLVGVAWLFLKRSRE